ncbi:protein C19orf12 homolog isoform X1 [Cetorhinus maximus]
MLQRMQIDPEGPGYCPQCAQPLMNSSSQITSSMIMKAINIHQLKIEQPANNTELKFSKMPVHIDDVMRLMCHISEVEKLQVAVKNSGKGALVAGAMAFAGGLVGGPPGIAVGGAVGGLLGAWLNSGQFKPLPQIIMELPPNQQLVLSTDVRNIVQHLDWTDAVQLISLVMGNVGLKKEVMAAMNAFFLKQLNAEVRHFD